MRLIAILYTTKCYSLYRIYCKTCRGSGSYFQKWP